MADYKIERDESLMHFGILGQKWGIRRFQNKDGTRTDEGKKRYSGGALGKEDYEKLKTYRKNVEKANDKFAKAPWGKERTKAEKERTEAYRKLDEYGLNLAKTFAKTDDEFKEAVRKRKEAEAIADAEWQRISDQNFIKSIATNKKDPRHKWFDEYEGHYEFNGDGTEFWEQLASEKAQKQISDARGEYRKSCHKALCKMFSNVMDRPVRKAVQDKNPRYNSFWGTDLMRLPVTSRMSEAMQFSYGSFDVD